MIDEPANVPVIDRNHHNHTTHPGPLTELSLRQQLLDECGFDKPFQVRLMGKVIASAESALEATKETPISSNGEITAVHSQPDHTARAKAREQIIDLIGVNAPTTTVTHPVQAPSIPLAPWMKSITVTSHQPATEIPSPVEAAVDVTPLDVTETPHTSNTPN